MNKPVDTLGGTMSLSIQQLAEKIGLTSVLTGRLEELPDSAPWQVWIDGELVKNPRSVVLTSPWYNVMLAKLGGLPFCARREPGGAGPTTASFSVIDNVPYLALLLENKMNIVSEGGVLTAPGGFLKQGESQAEGSSREFEEETGRVHQEPVVAPGVNIMNRGVDLVDLDAGEGGTVTIDEISPDQLVQHPDGYYHFINSVEGKEYRFYPITEVWEVSPDTVAQSHVSAVVNHLVRKKRMSFFCS